MKISFHINYLASWRQTVCIVGTIPQMGNWDETKALEMKCISSSTWVLEIELNSDITSLKYYYLIKENENVIRREWHFPHTIRLEANKSFNIQDIWKEQTSQKFLYTSGFSNSFFHHDCNTQAFRYYDKTILIQAICPYVRKNQELILCGSSDSLGQWDTTKALRLSPICNYTWQVAIDASFMQSLEQFKLAIYDREQDKIVHWEEGVNRYLIPIEGGEDVKVELLSYRYTWMDWKAAGVAIPVFSLRSEDSYGVGEFSDLKKLIDWAYTTKQSIIQILPINDTTISYSWTDSYPYNAISIYALHPIYLGLKEYPLQNEEQLEKYRTEVNLLNALPEMNYERVIKLKVSYIKDLFDECGNKTLKSKEFSTFFDKNESWLFPYACFTYLRDLNNTANYAQWSDQQKYDKKKLVALIKADKVMKAAVELAYFTQYLLHKQLVEVKEYAHQKGVILKGDIPIGISRNSVEAWVDPHLFNLDTQTGAPPDDFSINGQNWEFPTYNWEEMAKDGYHWWIKRFQKMADYFDAYRIDHILGFFRIWEIPISSVQGLLGHFSPAIPLSLEEIETAGLAFDEERMLKPYIRRKYLDKIFGEYTEEIIKSYLQTNDNYKYALKKRYDTQAKIKQAFAGKDDIKSITIRDGLYSLCNEVLFVRDKQEPDKIHPRITAQYNNSFNDLNNNDKEAFNHLYDNFFYYRHTDYWRNEAMKKLPALISSTQMLVCGEDLGMIPQSVPAVMNNLQILSLEIQRMPKTFGVLFEDMKHIPYMSVCTTSTHDMATIREWWFENSMHTQVYYNDILHRQGIAPQDCTPDICEQIVADHLNSPAMLAILPLQDWLSMDGTIRRENPQEERINIPAIPNHYWKYRMHITLEELISSDLINNRIRLLVESSGRG